MIDIHKHVRAGKLPRGRSPHMTHVACGPENPGVKPSGWDATTQYLQNLFADRATIDESYLSATARPYSGNAQPQRTSTRTPLQVAYCVQSIDV